MRSVIVAHSGLVPQQIDAISQKFTDGELTRRVFHIDYTTSEVAKFAESRGYEVIESPFDNELVYAYVLQCARVSKQLFFITDRQDVYSAFNDEVEKATGCKINMTGLDFKREGFGLMDFHESMAGESLTHSVRRIDKENRVTVDSGNREMSREYAAIENAINQPHAPKKGIWDIGNIIDPENSRDDEV